MDGPGGERLPLLISVPHGGDIVPPEVKDRIALREADLLLDGDAFTREVYDLADEVQCFTSASVARAVVDLSRAPDDLPPANPDGVVKTLTAVGTQVYKESAFPGEELIERLLTNHYHPYHGKLVDMAAQPGIAMAMDCHSMFPFGPQASRDRDSPRPLVCLGNRGDERGEPLEDGEPVTCPPSLIRALAGLFEARFGGDGAVTMNKPFRGGYITRSHSGPGRLPWVQLEVNRNLYQDISVFKGGPCEPDAGRIRELRDSILQVLERFSHEVLRPANY